MQRGSLGIFRSTLSYSADISCIIDESWYLETYPDVSHAGISALQHYMSIGWAEGRNPNRLFDTEWYFHRNPDVECSGINPLDHYVRFGWREGRSPHPLFDVNWFHDKYPETRNANPLIHYLRFGASKRLTPNILFDPEWYIRKYPDSKSDPLAHYLQHSISRALSPHPLFDGSFYIRTHPEVAKQNIAPLTHYLSKGANEALRPHPLFDSAWYINQYPDVLTTNEPPLAHYLKAENDGSRNPSQEFDAAWYLLTYPDVARSGMNPLRHFAVHGSREKRSPSPFFDTAYYLETNPDVESSGINALTHYILKGRAEGRPPRNLMSKPISQTPGCAEALTNTSLSKGPAFSMNWEEKSEVLRTFAESKATQNLSIPPKALSTAKRILSKDDSPPRISVVMPTWNRSATVCASIRSALNQIYKPYEIIVSDDGSEDDTVEKIRSEFNNQIGSGQIKIVPNSHRGVSATRNSGLAAATGDIVAYLDSDNLWRPEYLLILSAVFSECDEVCTVYAALESHNKSTGEKHIRANSFDRKRLLTGNFIDLNVFAHRRRLYEQCGGFDESLTRLVDWDLIVRYTKAYPPIYLPFIAVDYFLDKDGLENITFTQNLEGNFAAVALKNFQERIRFGVDKLRIAYFVYDYPALSQTFVLNELRWLVSNGYDVKVFYAVSAERTAKVDFGIEAIQVSDAHELATALTATKRNICHSHFAYPGVTNFVMPACQIANIKYTFMPHAVDIFHKNNRDRSRLAEISNNPHCLRVFVYGDHHRLFLESKGVSCNKISYNFQAIDPSEFQLPEVAKDLLAPHPPMTGLVIARFIEKKGIEYLIDAASKLRDLPLRFVIYGYGPLADKYSKKVTDYGLNNFEFRGPIEDRDALAKAYQAADFLVAPCVEAEDGDVDGFPTVILEAIAAEMPVVTTAVSAIPDYLEDGIEALIAAPRDAQSLADKIRQLHSLSYSRKQALTRNAMAFLKKNVGVDSTMRRFLDIWHGYEVDLFLVTYNTLKYEDRKETFEIVSRLLQTTTTPFTLTIVDNNSSPDFVRELRTVIAGYQNVRLIEKSSNIFCGPASNVALRYGNAEFSVYVCSKEGFVSKHGWERPLIEQMRASPSKAMAGYRTHLPKFTLGRELETHPDFTKFRNPNFAKNNPGRPFRHVQGGVFVIRRDTFERHGWYNELLPQNMMDVEFSYFLESRGAELGDISELRSISIKTLPQLASIVDESTVIAHPLSTKNVRSVLDRASLKHAHKCNLCGSENLRHSALEAQEETGLICETCRSTPFGRSVGQMIAHDHRTHRGASCVCLSSDPGLQRFLSDRLFKLVPHYHNPLTLLESQCNTLRVAQLIILDLDTVSSELKLSVLKKAIDELAADAALIVAGHDMENEAYGQVLQANANVRITTRSKPSRYLGLDWRPIALLEYHSETRIVA